MRANFLTGQPVWSSIPPADGQGGEHDGQVGFDRVALVVAGRAAAAGPGPGDPRAALTKINDASPGAH
jgi:hypothetical protein